MGMTREEAMKALVEFTKIYCDQVKKIMVDHRLFDEGMKLHMSVDSSAAVLTQEVSLEKWVDIEGREHYAGIHFNKPAGFGKEWRILESLSSGEFIRVFEDNAGRQGKHEGRGNEKPLPPDGLWISRFDDCDDVDSRGDVR